MLREWWLLHKYYKIVFFFYYYFFNSERANDIVESAWLNRLPGVFVSNVLSRK